MNKQKKIIVNFWYEGNTEEYYLKRLAKDFQGRNIKFEYKNLNGGNYKSICSKLERSQYTSNIFIILDLDRATNEEEKRSLEKLIRIIKKMQCKIFLTYKNFEDWLRFHCEDKPSEERFYRRFNVSSASEFKSRYKDFCEEIYQQGEGITRAEKYFKKITPYCDKNFKIQAEQINAIHSSLFALRDCLRELKP